MNNQKASNALKLKTAAAFCSVASLFFIHFSPALSSIFLGLFFVVGVIYILQNKSEFNWKTPLLFFSLLLVWQIISAIYNQPFESHLSKLQLKLPLLFLVFVYPVFNFPKHIYKYWLLGFVAPLICISLASLINYFLHYKFFNMMVLESKPIPLFSNTYHIEFNSYLAVSMLLILYYLIQNSQKKVKEKSAINPFLGLCFIIGIICLHVFAVRTAMVFFYSGLFVFFLGYYKYWLKRWPIMLAGLAIFIALFFTIPSLKNRIVNTLDDAGTIAKRGELNNKSGGLRLVAWKTALITSQKHLHMGVGPGKATEAMLNTYSTTNTGILPSNWKMPHNQWLELLLQSGWLSVFLFTIGLIALIVKTGWMSKSIIFGISLAMIFESLLERQDGVLLVCMLILLASAGIAEKNMKKN